MITGPNQIEIPVVSLITVGSQLLFCATVLLFSVNQDVKVEPISGIVDRVLTSS